MTTVHILKYINRFNKFKVNLCFFCRSNTPPKYIDLFKKDGLNFEVGNATFIYYQNGKIHREDGPAFVYLNECGVDYCINGHHCYPVSNEDFIKRNKMKAFW